MAFDDFQIRTEPAAPDEVLAILLEHHRQCCFEIPARPAPLLSRDSTIAEYEATCDVDFDPLTHRQINAIFNTGFTERQMLKLINPKRKKKLGDLCDAIAPLTTLPRIEPVTVFGSTSNSAGEFLVIRRLFADAGADAGTITPSAPIEPYLREHPEVYTKLSFLSPGRVPRASVVSPTHAAFGWLALLGQGLMFFGWLFSHTWIRLIGIGYSVGAIVAAWTIGRMVKPAHFRVGWLRTFRDLSMAMTGEEWGDFRGFPVVVKSQD